jgi:hypothetical protein
MSQVETAAHMSIKTHQTLYIDATKSHPYLTVVVLVFYYKVCASLVQYILGWSDSGRLAVVPFLSSHGHGVEPQALYQLERCTV